MKLLRALFSIFRRPSPAADAYEAEVLFAGWVDLPPLFREEAGRHAQVSDPPQSAR